jgi:hypothetical protein
VSIVISMVDSISESMVALIMLVMSIVGLKRNGKLGAVAVAVVLVVIVSLTWPSPGTIATGFYASDGKISETKVSFRVPKWIGTRSCKL